MIIPQTVTSITKSLTSMSDKLLRLADKETAKAERHNTKAVDLQVLAKASKVEARKAVEVANRIGALVG